MSMENVQIAQKNCSFSEWKRTSSLRGYHLIPTDKDVNTEEITHEM